MPAAPGLYSPVKRYRNCLCMPTCLPQEIVMQPRVAALAVSLALAFSTSLHAQTAAGTSGNNAQSTSSSGASGAASERSQNQKESARQQCNKMEGNAKAICNAQADGQEKINEAQKKVSKHDSPQHRLELAEARADAQFEVSKAR